MRLISLQALPLLLFLCIRLSGSFRSNMKLAIVTQFDGPTESRLVLLHIRSLLSSTLLNARENGYAEVALYACFGGDPDLDLEKATAETLLKLGVKLRQLHDIGNHRAPKSDRYWRNLVCTSQVADELFLANAIDVSVVFIVAHLVAVRDVSPFLRQADASQRIVRCVQKQGMYIKY